MQGIGWVVHDLADHDIRRRQVKGCCIQCAPVRTIPHAGVHGRGVQQVGAERSAAGMWINIAPFQSRIAAIDRVPERAGIAGIDDQVEPVLHPAAMLVEGGCFHIGIPLGRLPVCEYFRRAGREVILHQADTLGNPVIIPGVEGGFSGGVALVIPPAGGFRDHCRVQPVGVVLPAGQAGRDGKGPIVKQVMVDPVSQLDLEFSQPEKGIKNLCSLGYTGGILVDLLECSLGIPGIEFKGKSFRSSAGRAPIPTGGLQVPVARKSLDKGKVDVLGHVQALLDLGPVAGQAGHLVPGRVVAIDGVSPVSCIDLAVIGKATVCRIVRVIRPFTEIVYPPVQAIEIHVDEAPFACGGIAHVQHRLAGPVIPDKRSSVALARAPVCPRIVIFRA